LDLFWLRVLDLFVAGWELLYMVRNEQWSWSLHVWKFQCLHVENIRYEHVEFGVDLQLI